MPQFYMPLPGGQLVPLDAQGVPDFSQMIAGTDLADGDAHSQIVAAAAATGYGAGVLATSPPPPSTTGGLRLVASNDAPTFGSSVTVTDPKWLIFGLFVAALLIASRMR